MKLLGRPKSKITENKNGKIYPCLEITEVVLVDCSIINSDCQQNSRVFYVFVPINLLINYYIFHLKV